MAGRLNRLSGIQGAGRSWMRRAAVLALALAVIAIHGYVTAVLGQHLQFLHLDAGMPARMQVAYVRELELSAPPRAAPLPVPIQRKRRQAYAAAGAEKTPQKASQRAPQKAPKKAPREAPPPELAPFEVPSHDAAPDASRDEPQLAQVEPGPFEPAVSAPKPAASAPRPEVQAVAQATGTSPGAPPFEWPVSTRLNYVLTGQYRGEIHGRAQVEWIRLDNRYQVHMDVTIGPPFAPLFTRAITSAGQLTPQGLKPDRYDEDSKMAFFARRRLTIHFGSFGIQLPDGHVRLGWTGAQDAASQFVQLTYLFTTQPDRLAVGQQVALPLALPGSVDTWIYDVREVETLHAPFGDFEAFHLVPRRQPQPGGDLTAEMWIAPALAYLPARIRIWQDAETFLDLMIDRKPQLAAP
jgi:hypothetical protein